MIMIRVDMQYAQKNEWKAKLLAPYPSKMKPKPEAILHHPSYVSGANRVQSSNIMR